MHGKSDLKLSLQKIFPSNMTVKPCQTLIPHCNFTPPPIRLSKNVPQILADKIPPVFAPIIRNLAFTRLYPLNSCTCHSLYPWCIMDIPSPGSLRTAVVHAARSAYPDGRIRPKNEAMHIFVMSAVRICTTAFYLANGRQRVVLMPRKIKARSMHGVRNIRLFCLLLPRSRKLLHLQGVDHRVLKMGNQ